MSRAKRLEKLEQLTEARLLRLRLEIEMIGEVSIALERCQAALDAPTYARVEKVFTDYLKGFAPWLFQDG